MNAKEILDLVKENTPALWVLWEIKNLKKTFGVPEADNGPDIQVMGTAVSHTLYDSIENIIDSVGYMIGLYEGLVEDYEEERGERTNALEAMHIELRIGPESKRYFIISLMDEHRIIDL